MEKCEHCSGSGSGGEGKAPAEEWRQIKLSRTL
jgi:hypothetical protein